MRLKTFLELHCMAGQNQFVLPVGGHSRPGQMATVVTDIHLLRLAVMLALGTVSNLS